MRRLTLLAVCGLALLAPVEAQAASSLVEGAVTPVEWAPEVEVCLVGQPESCVTPGADGSYLLEAPEGCDWIEFVPSYRSRLLRQYYDGKATLDAAVCVPVFREVVTKGIDANLVEGGAIAGTVTSAAEAKPLPEVEVCALSAGALPTKTCTATDAGGGYELHSLSPGLGGYRIGFWGEGASAEYEPWYYQDRPSFPQGTPVEVESETTTRIDASLARGAQIRGIVMAAAGGAPLAGITVCLFAVGGPAPERCTASEASGVYAFQGLRNGSYQVGFSLEPAEIGGEATGGQDGFASQFYDGVGSRAAATTISLLAPATISGVDAVLAPPAPPPAPAPPPVVATPIVPAPPSVAEPAPHRSGCGKGRRRKRTKKGKIRCVKAVKHAVRRRHKVHRHHERRGRRHKRSLG